MNRRSKIFIYLGAIFIIVGLICNEWVLSALLSSDGSLEVKSLQLIRIIQGLFVGLGLLTIIFRKTGWIANLYLLLITLFIILAGVEIYLRIPGIIKKIRISRVRCKDEYLHHSLKPNVSAPLRWGRAEPIYHTNSLGYRDVKQRIVPEESLASTRILALGDSFAECIGVEYEDGFVFNLERLLRNKGMDVEILDAGVGSYCPSLEYRKLKKFLDKGYHTDKVILLVDPADIHDEAVEYLGWEKTGPEEHLSGSLDSYPMILKELRRRLATMGGGRKRRIGPGRKDWTEFSLESTSWIDRGIAICQDNILKIVELCRENSIDFIMVLYPYPIHITSKHKPSAYQKVFGDFARQHKIKLIDLAPLFYRLQDWESYFIPGDIHWNEKGHTFVAQALFDYLSSE